MKACFTIAVILLLWIFCWPSSTHAQKSATVHWNDGTVSRFDSLSEISIRLVYHWWSRKASTNDPGDYFRTIPVNRLREMVFVRQKGRYTTGFYYLVSFRGWDANGNCTEQEIPVWDWIDMTFPGISKSGNTRITFFHHNRKVKIVRIDFVEQ